mmetsp:Transcript_12592/g.23530  ORF Transcript_12592/g.23530 Transcript_12592/m.23530 type:complete len:213 (-) Transcript_12592:186-824(-)
MQCILQMTSRWFSYLLPALLSSLQLPTLFHGFQSVLVETWHHHPVPSLPFPTPLETYGEDIDCAFDLPCAFLGRISMSHPRLITILFSFVTASLGNALLVAPSLVLDYHVLVVDGFPYRFAVLLSVVQSGRTNLEFSVQLDCQHCYRCFRYLPSALETPIQADRVGVADVFFLKFRRQCPPPVVVRHTNVDYLWTGTAPIWARNGGKWPCVV